MQSIQKQKVFASTSTLWLLFLPIATISRVALFDQLLEECDNEMDDIDEDG